MANILDDTMNAAKNALDNARENAEQAVGTAKAGAGHAVESTRSTFLDGVHAVTGLLATLRKLDGDDALGWIGLARRRSSLYEFAVFGAGIAVGTGVGMMLAPMSGQKLRAMILDQLRGAKTPAKESMTDAGTTMATTAKKVEKVIDTKAASQADKASVAAKAAERKVEDFANKAGDAMKQAERKIENKVGAGIDAAKDAAHQVGNAAGNVQDMGEEARLAQKPRTGQQHSPNGRQPS